MPSFAPVVVIPADSLTGGLLGFAEKVTRDGQLPVILVNDGLGTEDARQVDNLAAANTMVTVIRHSHSRGMGYAFRSGCIVAANAHYTHAIELPVTEADIRNALDTLISAARENPDTLIIGKTCPCIPFWMKKTCSENSISSVCSPLRVYPLAATVPVLQNHRLPRHNRFFTMLLVHLSRASVRMMEIPVALHGKRHQSLRHFIADCLQAPSDLLRLFRKS